jgi:hypothetical protein
LGEGERRNEVTPREILEEVKRRIVADPGIYNQGTFCGMQCCIGGQIDVILNGLEAHNAHTRDRDGITFIADQALAAISEESPVWLFGQTNTDVPDDDVPEDELSEYWPNDLSVNYESAETPAERALVGCQAIDRYIKERGL